MVKRMWQEAHRGSGRNETTELKILYSDNSDELFFYTGGKRIHNTLALKRWEEVSCQ